MAAVKTDREIIESILLEYTKIPYAYGRIECRAVFDRQRDSYLLVNVGRDHEDRRAHGVLAHVDLIHGKFWIQCDGTEDGLTSELMAAGVPKSRIVLGYRPVYERELMDFAVN